MLSMRALYAALGSVFAFGGIASMACAPAESAPASHPRTARAVSAVVLMNGCTHLDATNAKLAESAMSLLTEDCTSVPGGTASFSAILNPNGRIELATPPGQPEVIPVCVVKRPLTHRVRLQKACKLDVRLEQTSIALPSLDAGAADH